ncbi:amidohydrolase [Candidatus Bathyarchaeota archaeon]|nr:amidohydrolase [Candidatus Bathyarchaeota archaeon]
MDKSELKRKVCEAIDKRSTEIIAIGDYIWQNPEAGFREYKTAKRVVEEFKKLGLEIEEGVGITGVIAKLKGLDERPNIAVMGELDALIIPEHPEADPVTGAVHACGHNAQITNVIGLAMGLVDSGIMEELNGSVTFMGVPSEEPIEIEWRQQKRLKGELFFLGGKQEFIKAGKFDDVDIALIDHMGGDPKNKISARGSEHGPGSDGFMAKTFTFKGVESHSGGAPWNGVNALNAAMLGLMGIHAQRETFKDSDAIRISQIISKGGDSLNVIPSEIKMELMVRGASAEAIKDACKKIDRAMKAGASAIGADLEIVNIPGYLPRTGGGSPELSRVLQENIVTLLGERKVETSIERSIVRTPSGVVADSADVAAIMPLGGLSVSGSEGRGHSREYKIVDKENAYVTPSKIYAMAIIDLLADGATSAKKVINEYKPMILKEKYMEYWQNILS